ncbi:hypothetical protein [Pseudomonas sp. RIT-To-2]|uniref:hypothetical protein n=1 Tax=Pseudomonas sp. RIT-To-2 TaxID=3462541 RepID=UPI00241349D1
MPGLPGTQKLDRATSDQSRISKARGLLLTETASTHWLNIGKSFTIKTWLDKTAIGGALRMQSTFVDCQPAWSEIGKNLLPGISRFN